MKEGENDMPIMANIMKEDESGRPTENTNNEAVRYTEVDNDLMNPIIEGYDPNNDINNQNDNDLNENNKEENNKEEKKQEPNEAPKINYKPKKISYNFKIIVIGDIAVGKTSVIDRYITNKF